MADDLIHVGTRLCYLTLIFEVQIRAMFVKLRMGSSDSELHVYCDITHVWDSKVMHVTHHCNASCKVLTLCKSWQNKVEILWFQTYLHSRFIYLINRLHRRLQELFRRGVGGEHF